MIVSIWKENFMRVIDEFVERVLNDNNSFNIVIKKENGDGNKTYHFMQI